MIGVIVSSLSINAGNTAFLIDVSGSVNGLSKDRTIRSFDKINQELSAFLKSNKKDSLQIVTFTDRVIDSFSILPNSEDIESIIKRISYPRKGNTNIANALAYIDSSSLQRLIIVSDGRHNIGSYSDIINKLSSDNARRQFFLLLDESDMGTSLVKEFAKSNYIKIIRSLTELSEEEPLSTISDSKSAVQTHTVQPSIQHQSQDL